jgi:FMN phosphatase YigB (HAD superfamily)
MPLTLEQYAAYLETRDIPWPEPPVMDPPKARPHLAPLPMVRAVTWNVYGTLLAIRGGELHLEHPQPLMMEVALDKTIQEFKMWGSLTRKPGQPADYVRKIYTDLLGQQRMAGSGGEKHPEIAVERIWEAFIKRLLQKDYHFDHGFYGSLNEFSRKVAYFFHASLQSVRACPSGAATLHRLAAAGVRQGLLGNGQCFTAAQLERALVAQDAQFRMEEAVPARRHALSWDVRGRQPSERLFRDAAERFAADGIKADQILHIGSRVAMDVIPARRLGMKTGLFAGDRASLEATPAQLREPASRPDVLLTDVSQIMEIVPA